MQRTPTHNPVGAKSRARRTWLAVALVLGTILAVAFVVWTASALLEAWRSSQAPPVDENGSVAVVFCPDCKDAFHALLLGGGDIVCALYDVGTETGTVLASVGADVVTDDETGAAYGEPVRGSALMHHKFCVINGSIVTSGSYNPTDGGAMNRNDLLVIHSPTLAQNYLKHVKALGQGRRVGAEEPLVYLGRDSDGNGRVPVENRFCPRDDCEGLLVDTIDAAQSDIVFLTFSFTSDPVGDALLRARERGVSVEGVCDGGQSRSERQYNECARVGAALWEGSGLLHHKTFIIDGRTVATGSYNPTASGARRNDENLLVITDDTLARAYREEYVRVREALG